MNSKLKTRKKKKKEKSRAREWTENLIWAIAIALILRAFVVQAYRIPSSSMEDTLLAGDFLLAEKITYRFRDPHQREIIIFEYPLNPSKDFVKRCIATGGQTVYIKDKVVFVDGKPFDDPPYVKYTDPHILISELSPRDNMSPKKIPPGKFFVMGDNRDNSYDSRFWGPLDKKYIKGSPMFIYFSWAEDPSAPKVSLSNPISWVTSFFYNLVHFPWRVRWTRIGRIIH